MYKTTVNQTSHKTSSYSHRQYGTMRNTIADSVFDIYTHWIRCRADECSTSFLYLCRRPVQDEWIDNTVRSILNQQRWRHVAKQPSELYIALHDAIVASPTYTTERMGYWAEWKLSPLLDQARHSSVSRSVAKSGEWKLPDLYSLLMPYSSEMDIGTPRMNRNESPEWAQIMSCVLHGHHEFELLRTYYPTISMCIHPDYWESFRQVVCTHAYDILDELLHRRRSSRANDHGTVQLFLCAVLYVNGTHFLNALKNACDVLAMHANISIQRKGAPFSSTDTNKLRECCFVPDFALVINTVANGAAYYSSPILQDTFCILFPLYILMRSIAPFSGPREVRISSSDLYALAMRSDIGAHLFRNVCMWAPDCIFECVQSDKAHNDPTFLQRLQKEAPLCFRFSKTTNSQADDDLSHTDLETLFHKQMERFR